MVRGSGYGHFWRPQPTAPRLVLCNLVPVCFGTSSWHGVHFVLCKLACFGTSRYLLLHLVLCKPVCFGTSFWHGAPKCIAYGRLVMILSLVVAPRLQIAIQAYTCCQNPAALEPLAWHSHACCFVPLVGECVCFCIMVLILVGPVLHRGDVGQTMLESRSGINNDRGAASRHDKLDVVSAAAPRRSSVCDACACVCRRMCMCASEVRYPVAIPPL